MTVSGKGEGTSTSTVHTREDKPGGRSTAERGETTATTTLATYAYDSEDDFQKPSTSKGVKKQRTQMTVFTCSSCKAQFYSDEELDEHKKIHECFCDLCGRKYTKKSNLNRHKAIAHNFKSGTGGTG